MNVSIKNFFTSIYGLFEILNEAIIYIIIAYVFIIFCLSRFLSYLGVLSFILFVPLKAFLYSGIYGALIEVMSGEEIIFSFSRFISNGKRYWKRYVLISFLLSVTFQFLRSILKSNNLYFINLVLTNLDIITMLIMAWHITKLKYEKLMNGTVSFYFSGIQIIVLIALCLLSIFMFYAKIIFNNSYLGYYEISMFLSAYFHFAAFLYYIYIVQQRFPQIKKEFDLKDEIFFINTADSGIYPSGLNLFKNYNPLFITVLKALTPERYKVRIFNKNEWRNRYYKSGKLVAISCTTSNSYEAYKIAAEFKRRGSKVIMGGHHVSHMPEEALEFCDSVVIGYAEEIWMDVIKDYENDSLKERYHKTPKDVFIDDIQKKEIKFSNDEIRDSLELFRGCKYRCDFCSLHAFGNIGLQRAPIDFLIERIRKIKHKYKKLKFYDNNIYCDPQYAKDFFRALKPLKIKWGSFSTVDIAGDEEALRLAKDSGCKCLSLGFETFPGSEEANKGGKYNYSSRYIEYAKKVKKAGISIEGVFIFGFDSDTFLSLFKLLRTCIKIWPGVSILGFLVPIPGSDVYMKMSRQDRLINLNWKKYNGSTSVFETLKLNNKLVRFLFPPIRIIFQSASNHGFFLLIENLIVIILLYYFLFNKMGHVFY